MDRLEMGIELLWNVAVAIGKPEQQVREASHCGSKQQ